MMHHPNMHHQGMGGPPPQHLAGQLPAHHHPPPHQMHRDNRHVPMQRVAMGPAQGGNGMGAHGQPMGGMGSMGHHHAPPQRAPHAIRAMHHPPQHHSMPQMKPMRRPYSMNSGYPGPGGVVYPPPQPPPPAAPSMPDRPRNTSVSSRCRPASPTFTMPSTQSSVSDFGVSIAPATASAAPPAEPEGAGAAGAGAEREERGAAVANSKEKTPMCLVNELARYNKIKHQYRLTSETGPAHKKVFTVTLRLGENEEYTAEGSSIKRAQHAAAHAALTQTRYPAPPPRAPPHHAAAAHAHRHTGTVMPTVELNALAMKLCQPAVYTSIPAVAGAAPRYPRARAPPPPGPYRMPFFPPIGGLVYRVRVAVGGRAWLGEGPTPQAARHDAAARALAELRPPHAPLQPPPPPSEQDEDDADPLNSEVKSPVSLVHELALKRNLSVVFTVKSERGPPHMRVFITACTVGDMETEGEGNGKKVSKRRAAERMLEEMRRRWPPALLRPRAPPAPRRRPIPPKKKPRNLIKESGEASAAAEAEAADNPISLLAMARHAARARSPQYVVLEERGAARRREFVVRCEAPPHRASGAGPSKKAAKRRAAMNVLLAMETGVNGEEAATNGEATANGEADATSPIDSKRKDGDSPVGAGEGRQPVPGLLLMQRSPSAAAPPADPPAPAEGGAAGSTDQLMYLAQLLGFTVQFSDFPKRNHGEYLSLVSLSTAPPVMCHGAGADTAASHEQCARAALRALRLMGLDPPPNDSPPAALSNGVAE